MSNRAWAKLEKIYRKLIYTRFDRSSLADLANKSCNTLDSNFTNNQTLSKSKPRLNVLIMVYQHIQSEALIH